MHSERCCNTSTIPIHTANLIVVAVESVPETKCEGTIPVTLFAFRTQKGKSANEHALTEHRLRRLSRRSMLFRTPYARAHEGLFTLKKTFS